MRRATLGPLHQIDLNRSLDGDRMSFGAPGATRKSFGAPGGTTKLTAAPSTNKKVATQSRTAAASGASFGPEQRCVPFPGSPAARGRRAPTARRPRPVTNGHPVDHQCKPGVLNVPRLTHPLHGRPPAYPAHPSRPAVAPACSAAAPRPAWSTRARWRPRRG
jgi:hypothetical protein